LREVDVELKDAEHAEWCSSCPICKAREIIHVSLQRRPT
jgi:hypothetical protein